MVVLQFSDNFVHRMKKMRDPERRRQVDRLIEKLIRNPESGKPMQHKRKGTREMYLGSFRLSYTLQGNVVRALDVYHKDEQRS